MSGQENKILNKHTSALLERHFDTAFAAPDGIKKLRELILTLAIQGKLVEHDTADQPALELLMEIEAEKKRLIKAGRIKEPRFLPPIRPGEVPYELPPGWAWVRLGNITINRDGERIPISSDERQNIKGEYDYYGASGVIDKVNSFIFDKSLLLIGEDGANLVNRSTPIAFMAHGKYWVNNHAHVIDATHPSLLLWLEKFINAIDLKPFVTGSAQPKMNQAKMNSICVALPPLAEQKRIVARIDQLMARCDELEKLRKAREGKRLAVHAAAIQQLMSMHSSTALDFIEQHFNELYSVKENVAELRKAILQLAIMGCLVSQDPSDQPASELLNEIEAEKQRLVRCGMIKAPKSLPAVTEAEKPYKLPRGWAWVRLGSVTQFINGDRGKNYPSKDKLSPTGIPFISALNLRNGTVVQDDLLCVSEVQFQKLGSGKLQKNDLVFCIRGSLGKKAIYPFDVGAIASSLVILRPFIRSSSFLRFTDIYLSSTLLFNEINKHDNGTAQPNLSANNFMCFLMPLPPLSEQHRIAAKIDHLMDLCNSLEHKIEAASYKQAELLNSVMAQV